MDDTLYKLVNPEFDFNWNGTVYQIKKATLSDVVAYQKKMEELMQSKESGWQVRLVSYCLYLALRNKIQGLTEEQILDNTPADVDSIKLLTMLGFLKPTKMETTTQINQLIIDESLSTLPNEPDGVQEKSVS